MDGNVIYNNEQPPTPPEQSPPADQSQVSPITSPQFPEQAPADENPVEPPPPGIINKSLIKKIAIGLGVLLFIVIIFLILSPKNAKPKSVTLVWWGLWEDSQVVQPAIADFERQYPNVTINYVKEDPTQYLQRLTTYIQNGNGPDIFRFHNTWYPMLSGDLMPLSTSAITPAAFTKEYYPVMQSDLIKNGAIYGIPIDADSLALFVNTDLLSAQGIQPPTEWDQFLADAKQLTVKDSNNKIQTAGAALGTYSNITHAPDIISLLLVEQGVNIPLFADASNIPDETTAFNFYLSFGSGSQNTWDNTLEQSINDFADGKLAMYLGYSWDVFTIQQLSQQNNPNLHFKIYPAPALYSRKGTIASYWVEGVSAKTQNQQAAMEFMNFLSQKSTLEELYTDESKVRSFGELYPRTDMASELASNPLAYPFVEQMPNASSSFFASDTWDGSTGINSLSNTYLENFINSIANDNGSMDTALPVLNQGILQVFQKYDGQ